MTRERVDVSIGGIFGGPADNVRKFVAGIPHYFIDDKEVSKEEYDRRIIMFKNLQLGRITDPCPRCGEQLEFDEVGIGVGVKRFNLRCENCHWFPEDNIIRSNE